MKLQLSKDSHLDADYCNEQGEVLYRVRTEYKVWPTSTKISKRIPNVIPRRGLSLSSEAGNVKGGDGNHREEQVWLGCMDDVDMKDRFAHLGRIEYKGLSPSRIEMGGSEFDVSAFFRKGKLGWFGRDRIFSGPDGKEYKWILGFKTSRLVSNDGSKTQLAYFHAKALTLVHKPENTYLEIAPAAEHILDMIIVTFVYIENLRQDREDMLTHAGGD